MKTTYIALLCFVFLFVENANLFAQRTVGAARFMLDDRTSAVRTVTLETMSPMTSQAYTLKFPAAAPGATGGYKNILAYDNNGNSIWVSGFSVITNATLLGDGTAANPLRINLGNPNTWTALQTFNGGLTAAGSATNLNSTNTNVNGSNFTTSNSTSSTFNGPVTFNNTVSQPLPLNNIFVGNASNRAAPLTPTANRLLGTDGAGNVTWTSVLPGGVTLPFSQITTGSNTTATMTVSAGASIIDGGGTIQADQFVRATGLGTTAAVDLGTSEVSGILPPGSGGTGTTTLDQDEILLGNGALGITSLNNPAGNAILTHDGSGAPEWTNTLPGSVTVPFDQVTSGTNSNQNLTIGTNSALQPTGNGVIAANRLVGAGAGQYTGVVNISANAPSMNIVYAGITANSAVMVDVFDPNAATSGFVVATITAITPGVGFTVAFSADYPSATGRLTYVVTNP